MDVVAYRPETKGLSASAQLYDGFPITDHDLARGSGTVPVGESGRFVEGGQPYRA